MSSLAKEISNLIGQIVKHVWNVEEALFPLSFGWSLRKRLQIPTEVVLHRQKVALTADSYEDNHVVLLVQHNFWEVFINTIAFDMGRFKCP